MDVSSPRSPSVVLPAVAAEELPPSSLTSRATSESKGNNSLRIVTTTAKVVAQIATKWLELIDYGVGKDQEATTIFLLENAQSAETDDPAEYMIAFESTPTKALGFCVLKNSPDNKIYLELDKICVHPAAQGKGVGSFLLKSVENITGERGLSEVRLTAEECALPFYEKMGYTPYAKRHYDLSKQINPVKQ